MFYQKKYRSSNGTAIKIKKRQMPSDCNYQKKKNQLRGPNELINSLLLICTKFIQMCVENGTKYQTFRGFSLFLSGLKQLPHVVHLSLCLVICPRLL